MLLVLLARAAAEDPVAIAAASASSGTGWQEWLESMIPASANLPAARASEASLQKELQASKADLAAARASEDSVQKELQAARDAAAKATEAAAAEGSSRQQWLGTMIALVITAYVLGRSAAKQAVADARREEGAKATQAVADARREEGAKAKQAVADARREEGVKAEESLSLASELLLEQVAAARREERAKAAMALGASLAALKKSGKATESHEAASSAANAMTETKEEVELQSLSEDEDPGGLSKEAGLAAKQLWNLCCLDPVEVKLEQLRAAIDNAQELQVPYADLWNARQALQRAGFAQQRELAQDARRDLAQRELSASCESPLDVDCARLMVALAEARAAAVSASDLQQAEGKLQTAKAQQIASNERAYAILGLRSEPAAKDVNLRALAEALLEAEVCCMRAGDAKLAGLVQSALEKIKEARQLSLHPPRADAAANMDIQAATTICKTVAKHQHPTTLTELQKKDLAAAVTFVEQQSETAEARSIFKLRDLLSGARPMLEKVQESDARRAECATQLFQAVDVPLKDIDCDRAMATIVQAEKIAAVDQEQLDIAKRRCQLAKQEVKIALGRRLASLYAAPALKMRVAEVAEVAEVATEIGLPTVIVDIANTKRQVSLAAHLLADLASPHPQDVDQEELERQLSHASTVGVEVAQLRTAQDKLKEARVQMANQKLNSTVTQTASISELEAALHTARLNGAEPAAVKKAHAHLSELRAGLERQQQAAARALTAATAPASLVVDIVKLETALCNGEALGLPSDDLRVAREKLQDAEKRQRQQRRDESLKELRVALDAVMALKTEGSAGPSKLEELNTYVAAARAAGATEDDLASAVKYLHDMEKKLGGKSFPSYWTGLPPKALNCMACEPVPRLLPSRSDSCEPTVVRLTEDADHEVLLALQAFLDVADRHQLGRGRDVKDPSKYNRLELARAWRLENHTLWQQYMAGRSQISLDMKKVRNLKSVGGLPAESHPLALELVTKSLKGFKDQEGKLDKSINETFLLHGTNGDVLLKILSNGLTEKFAGSTAGTLYGDGIYFAEDVTKSDQYVKPDMMYDPDSKLHRILYGKDYRHPGSVFYLLVCRVAIGRHVRTSDGITDRDGGNALFPTINGLSNRRELAEFSGTTVHPHTLLGERYPRFREFVTYHPEKYCYPEYIIAYHRYADDRKVQ